MSDSVTSLDPISDSKANQNKSCPNCEHKIIIKMDNEKKLLQKALEFEQKERKILESKVLEMVEMAVFKWKEKEKESEIEFGKKLASEQNKITDLTSLNANLKEEIAEIKDILKQKEDELTILKENKFDQVIRESATINKEALKSTQLELWRVKKDLANCQIDKRILDRELKSEKQESVNLKIQLSNIKESQKNQLDDFEETINKLKKNELDYKNEIKNLENTIENCHDEISKLKDDLKAKQAEVQKLNDEFNEKIDEIKNTVKKQLSLSNKIDDLNELLNEKDNQIVNLEENLSNYKKNNQSLEKDNLDLKKTLENLTTGIKVLKELAVTNENHLQKYENVVNELDDKEKSLKANNERLNDELNNINEQLKKAKQNLNEERSFKLLTEARCKRLQEDIDSMLKESVTFKNQFNDIQTKFNTLLENYNDLEEKYKELTSEYESLEKNYDELDNENIQIKEDSSHLLNQRYAIELERDKLSNELKNLQDENDFLSAQLEVLTDEMNQKNKRFSEREIQFDATIKQHKKLIEFLQNKISDKKN